MQVRGASRWNPMGKCMHVLMCSTLPLLERLHRLGSTGIFPNAEITKKLDEAGVLPGGGDWKPRT